MFLFLVLFALALSKTTPANNVTIQTRACLPPHDKYPFCDHTLPLDQRIRNLISYLHADEKPHLLTARNGGGGSPGPGSNISRLGIPEYNWGVNCIHGVQTGCVSLNGKVICPTSFPNPVNYGMTFNSSLFYDLGRIIATELRALWVMGVTEYSSWSGQHHAGLDCWSPNINIARDPRWGRNQETPSEDPFLNGEFGRLYTQGLQEGEDKKYVKVVVTLKHWDAYSLEDSDGKSRHNFNAVISNATLQDTYFPAFKTSIIDGKAKGVMCSYNALNGIPTCANPLLTATLKKWNYDGYVTSDTGAVSDIFSEHHYVKTGAEASCKAIVDGRCDIDSGAIYHNSLLDGVNKGFCKMTDVDNALFNTLKRRFELGLFDPIQNQPYWHVGPETVATKETQAINLLSTLESMVLLKNQPAVLPLSTGKTIAVIGPHGKAQSALVGNYLGQLCPEDGYACIKTPLQAITELNRGGHILYQAGCPINKNDTSGIPEAINAAKQADYVVMLMGIDESMEGEEHDRTSIDLPYIQHQLIAAIVATGKPTILVLLNGGMLAIAPEKASVHAILEVGYPGMLGAEAIAKTLFGQNDHLGGKLPYTVYPADYIDQVKMSYMEMEPHPGLSPGRSYRYYTGTPLYEFGYGLSLTTFKLVVINSPRKLFTDNLRDAVFHVNVTNTGHRTGDEVVFIFLRPSTPGKLIDTLIAFQRVHLAPGASKIVTINVPGERFAFVDRESADRVIRPGQYTLRVTNGVEETTIVSMSIVGDTVVVDPWVAV